MKSLLMLLAFGLALSATAQRTFKLRKNQKAILSAKILLADTLVLEDNSTIQVPEQMAAVTIIARYAVIGNNVTIEGSRKANDSAAMNGSNGIPVTSCISGNPGGNGQNGRDGKRGADIVLYLRIASLGSILINSAGSRGSNGGNGGNGGKGADGKVFGCQATPGGRGGNGGNGGDGGDGGNVVFNYTMVDAAGNYLNNQPSSLSNVSFNNAGAPGGNGGLKGLKGEAGKITSIGSSNLNASVPEASNGANGKNGSAGYSQVVAIKQNF